MVTRWYDPLLEKVTAWAATPQEAIARMDRALREYRIRGVATNLAFLEAVLSTPNSAPMTTPPASSTRRRSCFTLPARRDRASKLLHLRRRCDGERPSRNERPRQAAGRRAQARSAQFRQRSNRTAPSNCSTSWGRRNSPPG